MILKKPNRFVWLLSLLLTYSLFWALEFVNYARAEGLQLWFVTINTWHVSVLVNLGNESHVIHIGAIELVLLLISLALFCVTSRDPLLTIIFLFSTTLGFEIGTYIFLNEYIFTFVTSVQVFWHLPLITNVELLLGSMEALVVLVPIWRVWKIRIQKA